MKKLEKISQNPSSLEFLNQAIDDAERWLAHWMHECAEHVIHPIAHPDGAQSSKTADIRDLNYAISAIQRLIEARKKLQEAIFYETNPSSSQTLPENYELLERRIHQIFEQFTSRSDDAVSETTL